MRKGLLLGLIAAVFVVLSGVSTLRADQITLDSNGNSAPCTNKGGVTVTPYSTTTTETTFTLSGGGFSDCNAWFSSSGSPNVDLLYTLGASSGQSSEFSISNPNDSNFLISGTVNWNKAQPFSGDATTSGTEQLIGYFLVSSVTNGSDLNGEYVQGGNYYIDLTFQNCTEGTGQNAGTLACGGTSSGEIQTPEPGSLLLLGTGLLGLGGIVRRKFMKF